MSAQRRDGLNWPLWLTLGIGLLFTLRVWSLWSQLPDPMASHYGLSGRADSYMSKNGFFVVMGLIGGGTLAAIFATPALIRRLPPGLINIPHSDYWLANDERREIAIDRMADLHGGMAVATAALLAMVAELVMRANIQRTNLDNGTFLVFMVAYIGYAAFLFFRRRHLLKPPTEG
jgi:uncharacterized membrane protein